jgi:long-chain fatty acid transport protein
LLVIGLLAPEAAQATNGYFMHGVGTRSKALAGAGVAFPQDALAAGSNPAGMAFVGKRYDAGLAIFNPNREYTVSGAPSGFPGTFGLIPGTVESDSNYFPVPNFGANWELSSGAALGLSIYGQGGMNTDWPTATFYDPTSSSTGVDLSQLFVVPTWAQSYGGGRHAIGLSPILAYQMFEIEGVLSFGPFSSDPAKLSGNGTESSTGFGFKVGYLGQLTRAVTFGASYQSEISMDEFGEYAGLFAEQGGFDIPSTWTAGFAYRFGDRGAFLLDYQEIFYSDAASVSNPFLPNLAQARLGDDGGAGFGWQDMEVVKVGYQWGSGAWTWRLGFSTTDQPIPPSEVLFNILAPGVMEEHFTFGFTKAMGNGREFNFALMHAPAVSVSGPNPLEAPGLQTIEFEMDQWDLEIGFTWGR